MYSLSSITLVSLRVICPFIPPNSIIQFAVGVTFHTERECQNLLVIMSGRSNCIRKDSKTLLNSDSTSISDIILFASIMIENTVMHVTIHYCCDNCNYGSYMYNYMYMYFTICFHTLLLKSSNQQSLRRDPPITSRCGPDSLLTITLE